MPLKLDPAMRRQVCNELLIAHRRRDRKGPYAASTEDWLAWCRWVSKWEQTILAVKHGEMPDASRLSTPKSPGLFRLLTERDTVGGS